jgi:uncharacterized RmlC-like cupin family protein
MEAKSKYLLKLMDGREEPIRDLVNTTRTIIIDKYTVGAEDITFGYCKTMPKIAYHKKHIHKDAEELMYVLSGRSISGVGDQEFIKEKGDTVWVPRGVVHWGYNPFDEPVEFLFVYTRPTLESAGYEIVG